MDFDGKIICEMGARSIHQTLKVLKRDPEDTVKQCNETWHWRHNEHADV